jgi:hypothetical protein
MINRLRFLLGNNTKIPSTIHFSKILDESLSSDVGKGRSVRSTTFYERVVDNEVKRFKRAFWTDSLSEITGLARQVDVDKALSNEEKIVAAEKHDEEEIEILEERSNLILEYLKHNSEKLIKQVSLLKSIFNDSIPIGSLRETINNRLQKSIHIDYAIDNFILLNSECDIKKKNLCVTAIMYNVSNQAELSYSRISKRNEEHLRQGKHIISSLKSGECMFYL